MQGSILVGGRVLKPIPAMQISLSAFENVPGPRAKNSSMKAVKIDKAIFAYKRSRPSHQCSLNTFLSQEDLFLLWPHPKLSLC
jgi:hypothetical protein